MLDLRSLALLAFAASACSGGASEPDAGRGRGEAPPVVVREREPPRPPSHPPSNALNDEFPLLPPGPAPRPRALVARDGPMTLIHGHEHALLVVDGEPIVLGPSGPQHTSLRGLEPLADTELDMRVVGFVELPSGDAYLATHLVEPRGGFRASHVLRRRADTWTLLPDVRVGPLVGSTHALVEREGVVFELRTHRPDPQLEGDDEAHAITLLEDWPPRFVALEGSAPAPTLPPSGHVDDLVSDPEGRLYALWREPSDAGDWAGEPKLLVWPPDRSEPDIVELPDAAAIEHVRLAISGFEVLLFGTQRYLAIARGREVRRIRVVLPEPAEGDPLADLGDEIGHAVLAPTGELWISIDSGSTTQGAVWHRAPNEGWGHVELPRPGAELDPPTRWAFVAGAWTELAVEPGQRPEVYAMAWSQGRMWIHAALHLQHADGLLLLERELLYGVGGAALASEVLPPLDRRWFARALAAPRDTCRFVSLVLGERESLTRRQRSVLQAHRERLGDDAIVYLGVLEGRRELVVQARRAADADTRALARELGEALGLEVHVDCRPRDFVALVLDLRA